MAEGIERFKTALVAAVGPNFAFWALPWAGALMIWWDKRLTGSTRFLVTSLALCSLGSIALGFQFRGHYFIALLPALALLTGFAVSRSLQLLRPHRTMEFLMAATILGVFCVGMGAAALGNGSVWFASPDDASWRMYGTSLFAQARELGADIQSRSSKDARIAVIGSEPEIYFYARSHSATGYIYTYPFMELQEYATNVQAEMIAQIEKGEPEYVVFVNDCFS
jgi:hypothetical protein